MSQPPTIPGLSRPPRRRVRVRSVLADAPTRRSVQIGVVVTVLVHVLLFSLAPKIERWLELGQPSVSPTEDWKAREFQIEIAPAEATPPTPPPMVKFVEANPAAPDNAPDKTNNVAAQNQQVAQETPTPNGKSDAPKSKGEPDTGSTAIVSGQLVDPQPAARPTSQTPPTPETPEQQAARRAQIPLPGVERFEGPNPDGIGTNVGKPDAAKAESVPERIEGDPNSNNTAGARSGLYYKVDAKRPQARPTLAPSVVRARPSPLANHDFGTENIGAVAYDAKWSAYGEYLQKFIESVDVQWKRIIEQSTVYPTAGTKVVVVFRMDSKGDISQIVKVESAGGRLAKDACVSAIVARAPYGEWPEDMIAVLGQSQELTFTFNYN